MKTWDLYHFPSPILTIFYINLQNTRAKYIGFALHPNINDIFVVLMENVSLFMLISKREPYLFIAWCPWV